MKAGGNTLKRQSARGQREDQWFRVASAREKVQTCVKLQYQQGDFHTWKCIEIFHSVA